MIINQDLPYLAEGIISFPAEFTYPVIPKPASQIKEIVVIRGSVAGRNLEAGGMTDQKE